MKSWGYTEKELTEVFAFQSFHSEREVLFNLWLISLCIAVQSVVYGIGV